MQCWLHKSAQAYHNTELTQCHVCCSKALILSQNSKVVCSWLQTHKAQLQLLRYHTVLDRLQNSYPSLPLLLMSQHYLYPGGASLLLLCLQQRVFLF